MFDCILIANRGEIALRVMRSAQRIGVRCIAVYSDADQNAQHVLQADHAVHIGGALPAQSYLCGEKIIAAASPNSPQTQKLLIENNLIIYETLGEYSISIMFDVFSIIFAYFNFW